ncbi:hypothetical protein [Azospirillum canadense]|uniref:hypothetical protein n=1 Tax=Azospirillum canadense TaxID=403962 RepID=UPI003872C0B6
MAGRHPEGHHGRCGRPPGGARRHPRDVGARFVVSPGLTDRLGEAAKAVGLPYLPGTATVTEAPIAYEHGFRELKFFPAMLNGGAPALKGMAPLLPDIRFCPTRRHQGGECPRDSAPAQCLRPRRHRAIPDRRRQAAPLGRHRAPRPRGHRPRHAQSLRRDRS